jgi:hypothetical protein
VRSFTRWLHQDAKKVALDHYDEKAAFGHQDDITSTRAALEALIGDAALALAPADPAVCCARTARWCACVHSR